MLLSKLFGSARLRLFSSHKNKELSKTTTNTIASLGQETKSQYSSTANKKNIINKAKGVKKFFCALFFLPFLPFFFFFFFPLHPIIQFRSLSIQRMCSQAIRLSHSLERLGKGLEHVLHLSQRHPSFIYNNKTKPTDT